MYRVNRGVFEDLAIVRLHALCRKLLGEAPRLFHLRVHDGIDLD